MEAFPLRAVAHAERLTVTEHLTELRARLLLSVAVLAVLFAGCLWQSRPLLRVLNAPLAQLETSSAAQGSGIELPKALARGADAFTRLAHASSLAPSDRRSALSAAGSLCNRPIETERRPHGRFGMPAPCSSPASSRVSDETALGRSAHVHPQPASGWCGTDRRVRA